MRYLLYTATLTLVFACSRQAPPPPNKQQAPAKGPMKEIARWAPKGGKKGTPQPVKPPQPAATPAPQPRKDLPPPIKGPIPALKKRALKKEGAKAIVKKLIEAHYDAERLGLRELRFTLAYANKGRDTSAKASGFWKSGGPPNITIGEIVQNGKKLARESKVQGQMHTAMKYRLRRLLDGLGNGFLARRLFDLSRLDGEVEKKGAALVLRYKLDDEAGSTMTLRIVDGYHVARIERTSPKGVIRAMDYEYQVEGGRNLVRTARMSVSFTKDAKIPQKARAKLAASNKTRFKLSYEKIGRFFVPTLLHKTMPISGDEIFLELKYSAALPK